MEHQPNPIGRITRMEREGISRNYAVYLGDEEDAAYHVHENVVVRHRLLLGTTIDAELSDAIVRDQQLEVLFNEAVRMLGRAPLSREEVRRRLLRKGHADSLIAPILEKLRQQGYLDDAALAEQWTEHRVLRQRRGRNWARQELRQKGIGLEHVQRAVEGIDPEQERQGARYWVEKRWPHLKGDARQKAAKMAAFLVRRGYPASVAFKAMQEANVSDSADEWSVDRDAMENYGAEEDE